MGTGADGGVAGVVDVGALLAELDRRGYVVIERAVDDAVLERIRGELTPWIGDGAKRGRNDFEGFDTNRVYALLGKAPSVCELVLHPTVLAMLDASLLPGYLLSANLVINLLPGETAQRLHFDDSFYPLPRPRPPVSLGTIWAIDDFTAANGATEVIPGSHRWADEVPSDDDPRIVPVEMPAGSVVVFAGTLWHRGGANRTDRPRCAISPQYCEPWARQQENMVLALGAAATDLPARAQELIGYSIHPPFMGHADGRHPLVTLLGRRFDSDAGRIAAEHLAAPTRTAGTGAGRQR